MAQAKGQPKEKEPPVSVNTVYRQVLEDVIQRVRDDFQSDGVDESVLVELRHIWESKMMKAGAIEGSNTEEPATSAPAKVGTTSTPVHDLNVPYEPTDECTPTLELLFPPTPQMMTPIAMTPLPETPKIDLMSPQIDLVTPQMGAPPPAVTSTGEPIMFQYMLPGPGVPMDGTAGASLSLDSYSGRFTPYMPRPAAWMNRKPIGVDVNIDMNATYEEVREEDEAAYDQAPITKDFFTLGTGKRKWEDLTAVPLVSRGYIPQRDGAGDGPSGSQGAPTNYEKWAKEGSVGTVGHESIGIQNTSQTDPQTADFLDVARVASARIPQCDGVDDGYNDGVAEEDYNEPGDDEVQWTADGASRAMHVEPKLEEDSDGGEPPLNEDDDEDFDANGHGAEDPPTDNLVLAQFEKVTRSKNKWKCVLKDCVMKLNGKDVLFVKANGEFEF